MNRPLPTSFYDRPVEIVARELVGKRLLRETADGLTGGRIVEVEAYLSSGDSASHAARGETRRNASMFGPPGRAYVYAIHARWCLNAVTEPERTPSAVLIRAIEPLDGVELMSARRGVGKLLDLARGPARLCEALDIRRELDGWDLTLGEQLWIARDPRFRVPVDGIAVTPRIGVTSAHDLPLRFHLLNSRFVSRQELPRAS